MADPTEEQQNTQFSNLDMKKAKCFGFSIPKNSSWEHIAQSSISIGWRHIDKQQLEEDLTKNVDESYYTISLFVFKDLDTEIQWKAQFINDKMLWSLEILDSPDAEVLDEDKTAFFNSEMFKKSIQRAGDLIYRAKKTYDKLVKQHLENGELLKVDDVKLGSLLWYINNKIFMDNLRAGKYIR